MYYNFQDWEINLIRESISTIVICYFVFKVSNGYTIKFVIIYAVIEANVVVDKYLYSDILFYLIYNKIYKYN